MAGGTNMTKRFFIKRDVPADSTLKTWVEELDGSDGTYSSQIEIEDLYGNRLLLEDISGNIGKESAHSFSINNDLDYMVRVTALRGSGSPRLKIVQAIIKVDGNEYGKNPTIETSLTSTQMADRMLVLIES